MKTAQHHIRCHIVGSVQRADLESQMAAPPAKRENVAQIIERQLLVGAIGYVACVSRAAFVARQPLHYATCADAKKSIERTKDFRAAAAQIVVHGDAMNRHAPKRSGDRPQPNCRGLALTPLHPPTSAPPP